MGCLSLTCPDRVTSHAVHASHHPERSAPKPVTYGHVKAFTHTILKKALTSPKLQEIVDPTQLKESP
jgi:hypothetical protein